MDQPVDQPVDRPSEERLEPERPAEPAAARTAPPAPPATPPAQAPWAPYGTMESYGGSTGFGAPVSPAAAHAETGRADAAPSVDPIPAAAEPSVDAIPAASDTAEAGAIVPPVGAGAAAEPAPPAPQAGQGAAARSEAQAAKSDERRLRAQQAWERVLAARETNETLNGTVTAAVKGGLLVDVGGIRGFLPASQVRPPHGTAIEALVKAKLPLRVIDIDQSRRRIVVSHRRALEEERRAKRRELLGSLQVGQVREGTIVRLTDFGAFVDLGGIDGLIPMRELAFERVETAADVVRIGEQLPVEVLRIEEGGKKISLSRRNALADPWRDHANLLRTGTTVEGKVVSKEPRLQVEIAPGVVGTVRESDANPADYEIGEAIEVSVRSADRRTRRITLATTDAAAAAPPTMTSSGFAPLGVELGRRT